MPGLSNAWKKSSYSGSQGDCVEVAMHESKDGTRPLREAPNWQKSSFSNAGGDCVEVAESAGRCAVRDSTAPDLGFLDFTADEWSLFLRGVKDESFGA